MRSLFIFSHMECDRVSTLNMIAIAIIAVYLIFLYIFVSLFISFGSKISTYRL